MSVAWGRFDCGNFPVTRDKTRTWHVKEMQEKLCGKETRVRRRGREKEQPAGDMWVGEGSDTVAICGNK